MTKGHIAVVGAGIAGLACSSRLLALGRAVTLFDKARGPGGRMSTRRIQTSLGEAAFDHGAQYFTAREPAFVEQVQQWAKLGLVAPWPAAGCDAWVGVPAMNSPLHALAGAVDARWSVRVDALERRVGGWEVQGEGGPWSGFDAVVMAVPAEQAAPLLRPFDTGMTARAEGAKAAPCWTLMVSFGEALPAPVDIIRGHQIIGWAAKNSSKPLRTGPQSWVVQATPEWSLQHLEDSAADVAQRLFSALAAMQGMDLPEPVALSAHRWRYARYPRRDAESLLWHAELGLGACGDWLLGPRVECAFLSGHRLAELICSHELTDQ